jgi:hypothetical protein
VPADRVARKAFVSWAKKLPADPARRQDALRYVMTLPPNLKDMHESLAFAEHLVIRAPSAVAAADNFEHATEEDRAPLLNALSREKLQAPEDERIPSHMRKLPVEDRKAILQRVLAFTNTFRDEQPKDVAMVMMHLASQSTSYLSVRKPNEPATELQRTLIFLTAVEDPQNPSLQAGTGPYLPNDAKEREDVLNYLYRWNVDPRRTYGRGLFIWSIWFHVTNPYAMAAIHGFFLIVMTMFALGLFTRITSVITWLGIMSYINRSQQILFGMDTMMNIALFYLVIGPSGAALSLDRLLEKRRAVRELEKARRENGDAGKWEAILAGPRPSSLANFVTRLVQIHFCFIYAASGLAKLKGPAWWNHTAVWYTIANPEFSPTVFRPYLWFLTQLANVRWLWEIMMTVGTGFTLFLEIGFPFLVWRRVLRPYMLILAILLHTGIAVFMGLTVFGLFMMTLLMAYIPPETVKRWLELGEKRLAGSAPPAPAARPVAAKV